MFEGQPRKLYIEELLKKRLGENFSMLRFHMLTKSRLLFMVLLLLLSGLTPIPTLASINAYKPSLLLPAHLLSSSIHILLPVIRSSLYLPAQEDKAESQSLLSQALHKSTSYLLREPSSDAPPRWSMKIRLPWQRQKPKNK